MNATRAFNVITLTTILLLAGCLGADDSSAAADDHTHDADPNAAPVLEVNTDDSALDCSSNLTCDAEIYYASVDPDGDLIELGWDYDLDGVTDYTLIDYRGFSTASIPKTEFVTLTNDVVTNTSFTDCSANGEQIMTEETTTTTSGKTTIALIAVDSRDSASAVLVSFENFEVEIEQVSSIVSCTPTVYTFSYDDAAGTMSDAGGEALVEISMTQGTDLNWAMLKVSIKVDGGTPISCGDADSDAGCVWTAFEDASGNDQAWEAAEGITISEGSEDLCDGTGGEGGCDIQVTLTKTGTGNDADIVLGILQAFAAA